MAFAIGQKLLASQLNDFNPSGDVNPGDDIALGSGGVITYAADTNLYRASANVLKTDDALVVVGTLTAANNSPVGRPYLHAYQSSTGTQTLTTTTATAITFDAEILDTLGAHSTSVNPSRFTPTVAGYYKCIGQVCFAVDTTGDRTAWFHKNGASVTGATPYGGIPAMNGTGLSYGFAHAFATILCNGSTDYIELFGEHNKGSNLATASDGNSCSYMIIEWVSA